MKTHHPNFPYRVRVNWRHIEGLKKFLRSKGLNGFVVINEGNFAYFDFADPVSFMHGSIYILNL